MSIEEIKKKRFEYLKKIYENTKANTFNYIMSGATLGSSLGFNEQETKGIVNYLHKENLINTIPFTESIAITHKGIKEVELASENPKEPTEHFPPNIINVKNMINSQIQQGYSSNSSQNLQGYSNIKIGNLENDKKKGYIAGGISIIISIILGITNIQVGWNLSGQIILVLVIIFALLGIGSLIKPNSIGVVVAQIFDNLSKN